jgi:hypothetical protein
MSMVSRFGSIDEAILKKGGNDNVLHHPSRTGTDDDDAAQAQRLL